MPAWPQLSTVDLVDRALNPSNLMVWCVYSGSGRSCRRAKCLRPTAPDAEPVSVQAAAALPMLRQPLQVKMRIYLSVNLKRRPVGRGAL